MGKDRKIEARCKPPVPGTLALKLQRRCKGELRSNCSLMLGWFSNAEEMVSRIVSVSFMSSPFMYSQYFKSALIQPIGSDFI
jgi:hypothetical protein